MLAALAVLFGNLANPANICTPRELAMLLGRVTQTPKPVVFGSGNSVEPSAAPQWQPGRRAGGIEPPPIPIASPAHNSTGKSKTHGRINSAGARRGGGVPIEGACDSRSILRVLRDCSVHPQGPSLHSEPFIGTDALEHQPNKMECPLVGTAVFKGKSERNRNQRTTTQTNKHRCLEHPLLV